MFNNHIELHTAESLVAGVGTVLVIHSLIIIMIIIIIIIIINIIIIIIIIWNNC